VINFYETLILIALGGIFFSLITVTLVYYHWKERIIFLYSKLHSLEKEIMRHEISLEMAEMLPLPWEFEDQEPPPSPRTDSEGRDNILYLVEKD